MNRLLEKSPFDVDLGYPIGRDPRKLTPAEFQQHIPNAELGMKAIRAKCLDCAHTWQEVRKCTSTNCPLWHLRMGSVPKALRSLRKDASEKQGAAE